MSARTRVHRSDGLPFKTIDEPKGTGLFAEWADDSTLKALRFIVRGRVVDDREIVFEPERVRAPSGDSWSEGKAHDSYAGAFESYEPAEVPLMKWLEGIVQRWDSPTQREMSVAWWRRRLLGAVLGIGVGYALVSRFRDIYEWVMPRFGNVGVVVFVVVGFCITLPLLAFGPMLMPLHIRGHRVASEDTSS